MSAGNLTSPQRPVLGLGLSAVMVATVLVVVLPNAALRCLVASWQFGARLAAGKLRPGQVFEVLGARVLVGLFGVAVSLGTLVGVVRTDLAVVAPRLVGHGRRRGSRLGVVTTSRRLPCSPPTDPNTLSRCLSGSISVRTCS